MPNTTTHLAPTHPCLSEPASHPCGERSHSLKKVNQACLPSRITSLDVCADSLLPPVQSKRESEVTSKARLGRSAAFLLILPFLGRKRADVKFV